jgi:hypothetical protein
VAPKGWIEVPESRDRTPAERKVTCIDVVETACVWAKIERGAREYAIEKVALELRVRFEEGTEVVDIIGI